MEFENYIQVTTMNLSQDVVLQLHALWGLVQNEKAKALCSKL